MMESVTVVMAVMSGNLTNPLANLHYLIKNKKNFINIKHHVRTFAAKISIIKSFGIRKFEYIFDLSASLS